MSPNKRTPFRVDPFSVGENLSAYCSYHPKHRLVQLFPVGHSLHLVSPIECFSCDHQMFVNLYVILPFLVTFSSTFIFPFFFLFSIFFLFPYFHKHIAHRCKGCPTWQHCFSFKWSHPMHSLYLQISSTALFNRHSSG